MARKAKFAIRGGKKVIGSTPSRAKVKAAKEKKAAAAGKRSKEMLAKLTKKKGKK